MRVLTLTIDGDPAALEVLDAVLANEEQRKALALGLAAALGDAALDARGKEFDRPFGF